MSEPLDRREAALHTVDRTCPHCGATRDADQRYCLECGRPLPETTSRVASFRRRWLRRFGWYPGDWIALPLALLVVAAAGAAIAATVVHHRRGARPQVITAISPTPIGQPRAPAHNAATPGVWPAGENGWTVVLVSYPVSGGKAPAAQTAASARKSNLPQVGVLESSDYASLQPGYFVVFSGVYASETDASAALPEARQAGFGAAYPREVAD